MIKGIHHVSLKCSKGRQYKEVLHFYSEVLGMSYRTWGDEADPDGVLFDTGNGLIEIFTNKDDEAEYGIIRHVALETDNVDSTISKVRSAGYEVFISPKDISVPFDARVAFCFGPLGEQVELIQIYK